MIIHSNLCDSQHQFVRTTMPTRRTQLLCVCLFSIAFIFVANSSTVVFPTSLTNDYLSRVSREIQFDHIIQLRHLESGLYVQAPENASKQLTLTDQYRQISTLFEIFPAAILNASLAPPDRYVIRSMFNIDKYICVGGKGNTKLAKFSVNCIYTETKGIHSIGFRAT